MKIFYADDTYAKESKSDEFPKIHIFGGVIVTRESEAEIIEKIRSVKQLYTHPNMPVKWNFRDPSISKKFKEYNKEEEYQSMLQKSRDWRLQIFREVDDLDYRIVASCISTLAESQKALNKVKEDLSTFCFENVLMRVGIDAKEDSDSWQCVLDWPGGNNSKPFDTGYYNLYHYGKGASGTEARSGKLEGLGFSHSLHFTRCNHSPMIQFSDLIIGAIKDHIECKIQGRNECVGSEAVDIFYNHLRNLNGSVPKYGIIASSSNKGLSQQISDIFKRKVNKSE
jgi:hypothetical protein